MRKDEKSLKVVDFFCGAGGMSYGLQTAGLKILAGIDCDVACEQTYNSNIKDALFLKEDISKYSPGSLADKISITVNDDHLVFAGCSPCQFYSRIRTNKEKSQKTAFLLMHFQRFIEHFRPGFVVIENVPGLLTKKEGSALPGFTAFLRRLDYNYDDTIINTVDFGVPQHRKRYLLIATRLTKDVSLPPKKNDAKLIVRNFIGESNGFPKIFAGYRDTNERRNHTAAKLSESNLKRIQKTAKNGGTRFDWKDDPALQIKAYAGRDDIFRDVYGRMQWDKPSPTITTRFISLSNGRFGHPEEDRAISVREGATLQSFPKTFVFKSSNLNSLARQIGNAVPPELARRIGLHLKEIVDHAKV